MLQVPVNDRYLFVGGPLHGSIREIHTPLKMYHYISPYKYKSDICPLPQRINVVYSRVNLDHEEGEIEPFDIYSCVGEEELAAWLMSWSGKHLLIYYLDFLGVEL